VWAVMNAYNKVNGLWCAQNPFLLSDTLQKRWGFKARDFGLGSTYSTAATVAAGMHLEMPEERRCEPGSPSPERRRTETAQAG